MILIFYTYLKGKRFKSMISESRSPTRNLFTDVMQLEIVIIGR